MDTLWAHQLYKQSNCSNKKNFKTYDDNIYTKIATINRENLFQNTLKQILYTEIKTILRGIYNPNPTRIK